MKISVVMPVYNGEAYLREAIDSILEQSFRDFEFIIINDCSNDGTEDIVLSYNDERIVYIRNEENLGVARSLNRGLDIARGDYVARLDADDLAFPERLALQSAYLDSHPEVDVLGTASRSFDDTGTLFYGYPTVDPEVLKIDFLFSCGICHPTVMLRKSVLVEKQLRYDHTFNKIEDYELWCRMLDQDCGITNISDVLLHHRLHAGQVTNVYSADMLQKLDMLHRRQLTHMGIEPTQAEAESFLQFCLGSRGIKSVDYAALNSLLEKILASGYYDRGKFRNYCRGIVLRCMDKTCTTGEERRRFVAASGFISWTDVWKHAVRKFLKRNR